MLIKKRKFMYTLIFTSFLPIYSMYATADVAVIVHPSNMSTFDKSTIDKFYMGRANSFSNGKTVIPMHAAQGAASREEFNRLVVERTETQIKAYWSKLLFTGKGTPPKELASDAEMLEVVSANEGAIGYISSAAVTDAVKVVATFK